MKDFSMEAGRRSERNSVLAGDEKRQTEIGGGAPLEIPAMTDLLAKTSCSPQNEAFTHKLLLLRSLGSGIADDTA